MSEVSRRDFIKVTTGIVGGLIGAMIGLPTVYYLIDPALREGAKEAWIPIGNLENMEIGKPYSFSFTRVQVNGWERTATSHGGFVLRQSEDPDDLLILNSRCTHLACTVNWSETDQVYLCPCHDASFGQQGEVLGGPPPRPLDRFTEFRLTDDGVLEIFYKEA
ncbi:MAG TPA: ubiquinol-cytochrome c reductase iron-sulfur subunit [Anaerolineales bacterium]|nr:ubiquinol-cytochrome c reductase iron-sulfur subunit [Anaerolineales bacterium]